MNIKNLHLFLVLLVFIAFPARADTPVPVDLARCIAEQRCDDRETGFVLIPFLFYSAETSVGAGASFLRYSQVRGLDHKPNQYIGNVIGTYRKQLSLTLLSDVFSLDENRHLSSKLVFQYYPDKFFGIGKEAKYSHEEQFTPIFLNFENSYQFQLVDNLYLGPATRVQYSKLLETQDNAMLDTLPIPGTDGVMSVAIGAKTSYDSRNSSFYPTSGILAESNIGYNWDLNGNGYDYTLMQFDLKHYQSFGGRHVLASQLFLDHRSGSVPFQFMPKVGGFNMLRGYYEGRYRDKNLLATQLEYRMPIFWKIGGAVFASAGQVSDKMSNLQMKDFKFAGGVGLRFLLIEEQGINIRLDFGYSEDGIEFYITAMEAF